jgi:hypothetical protein
MKKSVQADYEDVLHRQWSEVVEEHFSKEPKGPPEIVSGEKTPNHLKDLQARAKSWKRALLEFAELRQHRFSKKLLKTNFLEVLQEWSNETQALGDFDPSDVLSVSDWASLIKLKTLLKGYVEAASELGKTELPLKFDKLRAKGEALPDNHEFMVMTGFENTSLPNWNCWFWISKSAERRAEEAATVFADLHSETRRGVSPSKRRRVFSPREAVPRDSRGTLEPQQETGKFPSFVGRELQQSTYSVSELADTDDVHQ